MSLLYGFESTTSALIAVTFCLGSCNPLLTQTGCLAYEAQ